MKYIDFTNRMITKYGEKWLMKQYGRTDYGVYWCEPTLFSELIEARIDGEMQAYFLWLDDFYTTVYEEQNGGTDYDD